MINTRRLSNVGVIKDIVRLAKNDNSKASKSILQIGGLAGNTGV